MPHNNAVYLSQRGVLRIGGEDRRTFLQGLISNDINLCTGKRAIFAALLTPQGKFLHDFFIVEDGDFFLMDCESARADDLLKRLTAYKLRAKVTLENISTQFDVWVMWSEKKIIDEETGGVLPPLRGELEGGYMDPRMPELGARAMMKKGETPENITRVDFDAYDKHRLTLGVPDGSRDMIIEKSTLLDGNYDRLNGISWTKGCYMGQELTARMYHRGLVKKRMFPVRISGPTPTFGALITLQDQEIGDMRSSCGDVGLALLNIEKAEQTSKTDATFTCGNSELIPRQPDWMAPKKL